MNKNSKRFLSKTLTAAVALGIITSVSLFPRTVSAAEETIINSTFESSTEGWTNLGNCKLMTAGWTKNSGNNSLYVGSRQNNWNGALYSLNNKVQAGDTFEVSAYWMSWQIHNTEDMKLTLTYKDNTGNTKYQVLAKNTAPSGQWTKISAKVTLPQGARQPAIYFETSKNAYDYYLDDVVVTKVSGNPTPSTPTDPDTPTNPGSIQEVADAYMRNIKIVPDCPANNSIRRRNVAYGSFVHKTYYSSTTRSNRGFNILLPANYNPQKKYPVLYVLHGIFGNENSLLNSNIPQIVANQVADGKAKDMIVVLPNIYADPNGGTPGLSEAGIAGYDNFVNDLEHDLMPYIEKNFSVSKAREDQAIAGFSMGGREALYIGITRPDLFGYVMGISPAPGLTPGRDWAMYHKGQLQENQLKVTNPTKTPYAIMLCCGTNDHTVGQFPESYHNILTRNNQNHIWYTVPGADHDNRAIQSGINNFTAAIFHAK